MMRHNHNNNEDLLTEGVGERPDMIAKAVTGTFINFLRVFANFEAFSSRI